jgi:mRNA interferase RelE/StbE
VSDPDSESQTPRKYRTVFTEAARADLRKVERTTALTILRKLAELETDPYGFATTELVTERGTRRLRVGDYRIFYSIQNNELIIEVVRVAHRSAAY